MRRSAWLAAILNFFFWGLGYVYAGRRLLLGLSYMACVLMAITATGMATSNLSKAVGLLVMAWLLLSSALAYDAYKDVKGGSRGDKHERR
jgi:hypothetical protein